MIAIEIDGTSTKVEPGTTLLEAARELGVAIPTLCNHPMVPATGHCRVCVTEIRVGGQSRLVTACNYPIREPLKAFTASERTKKERALVMEVMLSRWPNVPAVKALARLAGVTQSRFKHPRRSEKTDACVLCGLCVRACSGAMWEDVIGFEGKGEARRVTMPFGKMYNRCVGCGTCVAVCPTGAIKLENEFNHPADSRRIIKWGSKVTQEMAVLDPHQNRMREVGTANIIDVMDAYDLLPVHNFQYGSHPKAKGIHSANFKKVIHQHIDDGCCLGCSMACAKAVDSYVPRTGPYKGKPVVVDGPEYETAAGVGANCGIFEPWAILELNFYCDNYGVDTISFGTCCAFAMECYERGILDAKKTGGLALKFGNAKAALTLLHQMAEGTGFGVTVGQGVRKMKELFAREYGADPQFLFDIGMESKGLEYSQYVSKESLAQQGGYAMALKGPQHDEAWLIFMDMVNKQLPTFEDKANALHYFPMFRTWFGLQGLCKLPWNDVTPESNAETDEPHKFPSHVQGYCNFFAGMTGKEIDPAGLIKQSERVYNFQKVFCLRMGKGLRVHDVPPYRSIGPLTPEEYHSREARYDKQLKDLLKLEPRGMSVEEKVAALRKHRTEQYSKLQDAVYKRRGWTPGGIPTLEHLQELGIDLPEVRAVVEPLLEKERRGDR